MTSTGEIGRKFSIRMRSGGIIKEKSCATNTFYGKIFSAIRFYVWKAIVSLYFTKNLMKIYFSEEGLRH
jgi:hypothetical protein